MAIPSGILSLKTFKKVCPSSERVTRESERGEKGKKLCHLHLADTRLTDLNCKDPVTKGRRTKGSHPQVEEKRDNSHLPNDRSNDRQRACRRKSSGPGTTLGKIGPNNAMELCHSLAKLKGAFFVTCRMKRRLEKGGGQNGNWDPDAKPIEEACAGSKNRGPETPVFPVKKVSDYK